MAANEIHYSKDGNQWCCLLGSNLREGYGEFAGPEADCRAKMLYTNFYFAACLGVPKWFTAIPAARAASSLCIAQVATSTSRRRTPAGRWPVRPR
jgi:hypothetical protein